MIIQAKFKNFEIDKLAWISQKIIGSVKMTVAVNKTDPIIF